MIYLILSGNILLFALAFWLVSRYRKKVVEKYQDPMVGKTVTYIGGDWEVTKVIGSSVFLRGKLNEASVLVVNKEKLLENEESEDTQTDTID